MRYGLRELVRRGLVGRGRSPKMRESGFALPSAIGLGLVTILVATTFLIQSQNNRSTAALQHKTDGSLSVTEAGVTEIQTFLNNNRILTIYNSQDWATQLNTNTSRSDCSGVSQQDLVTYASSLTAGNWQPVDASNPSKGQFKLVSYTYIPQDSSRPQSLPGKGELIIEGRLSDGQSINRLKVTIPVLDDSSNTNIPGLWVTNGEARNNGEVRVTDNNEIQGNALVNDCRVDLSSIRVTSPYTALYTTRAFPPLPATPNPVLNTLSSSDFGQGGGSSSGGNGNGKKSTTSTSTSGPDLTLPRATDLPVTRTIAGQSVQVYEYWVGSDLKIPQNGSLTITPGRRVTLYLNGSLNGKGGGDIFHDCSLATGCQPTNFQIFGYGPTGSQICLNGNDRIYAFILGPNYTAGVAGAGNSGGFYGSVWTKDWSLSGSCGSNTTNAVLRQTANWSIASLGLQTLIVPKLAPARAWERQEIP